MDRDRDEPVFMISIAAQLTGLHPQTVRMYERIGLIAPQRVSNKNRMYSEADVARLCQIRRFTRDMGVNLAGVEVILSLLRQVEALQAEVEALRRVVQEQAEAQAAQHRDRP